MQIQRVKGGFSALDASDPLAGLDIGNPRKWALFMEDYVAYDVGQAAGHPWVFTQTNCVDTIEGPTGVLLMTLGGADNDLGEMQLLTAGYQTNSKRLYFECKFKVKLASGGTMAANELAIGLFSIQTGNNFMAADGLSLTADDALGLVKFDASAAGNLVMRENDVQSTITGAYSLTDDVYSVLSIYYDGSRAYFYKDYTLIGTLDTVDTTSVVAPTVYIKAGEAKANVLYVDYIMVAAER